MTAVTHEQNDAWRQRVAQRRREQSREQILITARELFAKYGYATVSVEQIAEQAGVGPATVYNHFGSKATIAAYLLKDMSIALQQAAEADIAAHLSVEVAVQRHFERLAQFALAEPLFVDAFLRGLFESGLIPVPATSDLDPRLIMPLPTPLRTILQAGQQQGSVSAHLEVEHAATMVTNAYLIRLLKGAEPMATAEAVTNLFLYGICGNSAPNKQQRPHGTS